MTGRLPLHAEHPAGSRVFARRDHGGRQSSNFWCTDPAVGHVSDKARTGLVSPQSRKAESRGETLFNRNWFHTQLGRSCVAGVEGTVSARMSGEHGSVRKKLLAETGRIRGRRRMLARREEILDAATELFAEHAIRRP